MQIKVTAENNKTKEVNIYRQKHKNLFFIKIDKSVVL